MVAFSDLPLDRIIHYSTIYDFILQDKLCGKFIMISDYFPALPP